MKTMTTVACAAAITTVTATACGSGDFFQMWGEVVSNTYDPAGPSPFGSDDWAPGEPFYFFSTYFWYEETEPDLTALHHILNPHISTGAGSGQLLSDENPFVFQNDAPGDSITWTSTVETGDTFSIDFQDPAGAFFTDLNGSDFKLDTTYFTDQFAVISSPLGTIEIQIVSISKHTPAPGAWCMVLLAGARMRRRRRR